jgi:hydroxymethylpyrimidine pyrophosphatase-like HAD family hydrolase
MLNKPIPKEELNKMNTLILDSDGVCVKRGTEIREKIGKTYELTVKTNLLSDELAQKIRKLNKHLDIYICSGRSLPYLEIIYHKVADCVFFIPENGATEKADTLIYIKQQIIKENLPIKGFEPKSYILTIHADHEIRRIREITNEIDSLLKVMWNGEAFDIQPKSTSKGEAIKNIGNTIAIGDRINDKEMLEVADIPVSADIKQLKAPYWTKGKGLPGEQLVDYLLKHYEDKEKMGMV